jgi:predicted DsbA family dithiol-disulfide isomerase
VEIEIYADIVCPWCYLGKRRLERALETFDAEVILRWRPFQLDPSTPTEARPLLPWLGASFGGAERARQLTARTAAIAAAEGLDLDFDRALIVNTFLAHRLVWFADRPEAVAFGAIADTQPEIVEALHRAHFGDGLDIGSVETLTSLAAEVGLDAARVRRLLDSSEGEVEVRAGLRRAHALGVTGVPTFVFAGRYAVVGAQAPATLRAALDQALTQWQPEPVQDHGSRQLLEQAPG